jgi:sec-independent protein translocase protein TatA
MKTALFGMLNFWEVFFIILAIVLFFGARKLPELARGLGQGIKEFKKASKDEPNKNA